MNGEVEILEDQPCIRCGGRSYLTARFRHPTAPSMMTVTLCPRCDVNNSKAHGLLAYFAYHSAVEADGLDDYAALLLEWALTLDQPGSPSREATDRDWEMFQSGDY